MYQRYFLFYYSNFLWRLLESPFLPIHLSWSSSLVVFQLYGLLFCYEDWSIRFLWKVGKLFNSLPYCKLHGILWADGVNWLVNRSPDMSQDVNSFRARNLPVIYLLCCTHLERVFRIRKNEVACRLKLDTKMYNSRASFNLILIYCRQKASTAQYSQHIRHITQKQKLFLYLHNRYIARCFK